MNSAVAKIVSAASGGYSTTMTCGYFLEEMCCARDTDDEDYNDIKYLRENMIMEGPSMTGCTRQWLDQNKWSELLRDPQNWADFEAVLRGLENYDIGLEDAISESGLCEDDLDTEEAKLLLREFRGSDEEYMGIDGLIQLAARASEKQTSPKRGRDGAGAEPGSGAKKLHTV